MASMVKELWHRDCYNERMSDVRRSPVSAAIIGAAIEVHRELGPGLLESAYKTCLVHELRSRGVLVEREVPIPVVFKGQHMDCGFRADLLVANEVLCEVKSVDRLLPVHTAQVLTYLRLSQASQALLINFNSATLLAGLKSYLRPGTM